MNQVKLRHTGFNQVFPDVTMNEIHRETPI